MSAVIKTPAPPYYAVIFTSLRTEGDNGYDETARRMEELSAGQKGFLGMEHARSDDLSITICYWETAEDITRWKQNAEHQTAQRQGYEKWYREFCTRICKVERDNHFEK